MKIFPFPSVNLYLFLHWSHISSYSSLNTSLNYTQLEIWSTTHNVLFPMGYFVQEVTWGDSDEPCVRLEWVLLIKACFILHDLLYEIPHWKQCIVGSAQYISSLNTHSLITILFFVSQTEIPCKFLSV